jgi:hypothetical protein
MIDVTTIIPISMVLVVKIKYMSMPNWNSENIMMYLDGWEMKVVEQWYKFVSLTLYFSYAFR